MHGSAQDKIKTFVEICFLNGFQIIFFFNYANDICVAGGIPANFAKRRMFRRYLKRTKTKSAKLNIFFERVNRSDQLFDFCGRCFEDIKRKTGSSSLPNGGKARKLFNCFLNAWRVHILKIYGFAWIICLFGEIGKTYGIRAEMQFEGTDRSVSVFCYDDFRDYSGSWFYGFLLFVPVFAVNEHNHVRILFDRARISQIRKSRAWREPLFYRAGKLGKREYGNVKLAR